MSQHIPIVLHEDPECDTQASTQPVLSWDSFCSSMFCFQMETPCNTPPLASSFGQGDDEYSPEVEELMAPLPPPLQRTSSDQRIIPQRRPRSVLDDDIPQQPRVIEDDDDIHNSDPAPRTNRMMFRSAMATIFSEDDAFLNLVPDCLKRWDRISAFAYGIEVCPTTGRKHAHIFMQFRKSVTGSAIWRQIGCKCWLQRVRSPQHAVEYCCKNDPNAVKFNTDTLRKQGTRSDLLQASLMIQSAAEDGLAFNEIVKLQPKIALLYPAGMRLLFEASSQLRDPELLPKVYVFVGAPGTGKTRDAHRFFEANNMNFYQKCPTSKWWAGYSGQNGVLIDEITGGAATFNQLLTWFSRGSPSIEVKGHNLPLKASTFILTSNKAPHQWYPNISAMEQAALFRRFTEVRIYTELDTFTQLINPDDLHGERFRDRVLTAWENAFPTFIPPPEQ